MPPARRDRSDIRDLLLEAAKAEFAKHGYSGASTTRIARRADAHQPQINYHFSSKAALWRAALDDLFEEYERRMAPIRTIADPVEALAFMIRQHALFTAQEPNLFRLIVHATTVAGERLDWLVEQHLEPRRRRTADLWKSARQTGRAAPLPSGTAQFVVVGAIDISLISELFLAHRGTETGDALLERHIASLIETFLPGYEPESTNEPGPRVGT